MITILAALLDLVVIFEFDSNCQCELHAFYLAYVFVCYSFNNLSIFSVLKCVLLHFPITNNK